jgi:hypothetical protein
VYIIYSSFLVNNKEKEIIHDCNSRYWSTVKIFLK